MFCIICQIAGKIVKLVKLKMIKLSHKFKMTVTSRTPKPRVKMKVCFGGSIFEAQLLEHYGK